MTNRELQILLKDKEWKIKVWKWNPMGYPSKRRKLREKEKK